MQLFVAGLSYREIARAVGLRSPQSVCNIVERGLADGGPRREPLADDALAMFHRAVGGGAAGTLATSYGG